MGPIRAARRAWGQKQQRQAALDLGLVGKQAVHQPGKEDRLTAQVARAGGAKGVALGEDQVDHRQNRGQPVVPILGIRHLEGDSGGGDLGLGTAEALAHRRLVIKEDAGDFGSREAAQQAQRQRHAGFRGQRGVAADEDQAQPVVGDLGRNGKHRLILGQSENRIGMVAGAAVATISVDRLAQRHPQEPALRVGRHPRPAPMHQRRSGGFLQRILGALQIAGACDKGGHQPPPVSAQRLFQGVRRRHP